MELSFYLGPGDHRVDVSLLLMELRSQGGDIGPQIFSRDPEGHVVEHQATLEELAELEGLGSGFACALKGLPGLTSKDEIVECEGPHVLLRTEAGPLSVPSPKRAAREAAGLKAYKAFKYMADCLDAAYGAVCIEYSLETPAELREDSRSLAFRNFWLSRRRISEGPLHRVATRMSGAYVEEWLTGIYFSTDAAYNPARAGIEPEDAEELSVEVAAILARAMIA